MAEEIKSPYIQEPSFDYNKLRDDTAIKSLKEIVKIMAEDVDSIFFPSTATGEEIEAGFEKVAKKIMTCIADNEVVEADLQFLSDNLNSTLVSLVSIISRHKTNCETELVGRILEAKDPGTGEISRSFGTLKDLFSKLEAKRREQGIKD